MKKIVQISAYYPPHLGGQEVCVKNISESLSQKGYCVDVYTARVNSNKHKLKLNSLLNIHYLKSVEIGHSEIMFFLLFKLLKYDSKSIIHVHIGQAYTPEMTYIISKLRKIPYIAHLHIDAEPSGKLGILLPYYKKFFLKRVLKHAKVVICLSKEMKINIHDKYDIDNDKIIVVPNGVSESFFIQRVIRKKKKTRLLFVGRLVKQKNLINLVKAVYLLGKDVQLDIIGDGEERKKIERLIYEKHINNIKLYGVKRDKNLLERYKKADIFILPSIYEGLPLALLEAMAAGLPIIASNLVGIKTLIKGNGLLIDSPTQENLRDSIYLLINNLRLQRKFSKKSQIIAKNYKWQNVVNKIEKIYKTI